jgi:hypothetical protein
LPIADCRLPISHSAIDNRQSALFALANRRSFLLRIDPAVLEAVQRWANDDLRSLNGQIEFLLRRALIDSGRGHVERKESAGEGSNASKTPDDTSDPV